ncbi:MAG TPA: hypothetical protein VFW85_03630 [Gaiellaceae bacterium]|nr:hypothetical protein [Gaiellaceae bacterium]
MKVKGLLACALVCALLGGMAGTAAATAKHNVAAVTTTTKKKPPAKKKAPAKKKKAPAKKKKAPAKKKATGPNLAAFYDCAKYITAARFTALAGGWGGTYTADGHGVFGDRAAYGPGGDSSCQFKPSNAYTDAGVFIFWGTKNAPNTYAGTKHTAELRGSQMCTTLKNEGRPLPSDPRQCGPVAVPGLGDQAFASYGYIMVLRGPMSVMISLPSLPSSTGNLVASQAQLVSMATAIMASIPLKPPAA